MKTRSTLTLSFLTLAFAGFATAASAQGLTRAEVRQQLIQAEESGSQFVTDASYPDVSPVFAQQVAQQKLHTQSIGGMAVGTTAAGAPHTVTYVETNPGCVGPVSFCTPYFGS